MSYIKRYFEEIQGDVEDLFRKYGSAEPDMDMVNNIASMVFEEGRNYSNNLYLIEKEKEND